MNNYLNIQANKKHLVTKITTRENYFANKKIFNKIKRISSNLKREKYTNYEKFNNIQNTPDADNSANYIQNMKKKRLKKRRKQNY